MMHAKELSAASRRYKWSLDKDDGVFGAKRLDGLANGLVEKRKVSSSTTC
jgi:hypothetical protein